VLEDRKRCGWGTVLAAVTLFATLLLTVPARPATAAPAGAVARLRAAAGVRSVTTDQPVRLHTIDGLHAKNHSPSTMYRVAQS
jgi:hypothetical protein